MSDIISSAAPQSFTFGTNQLSGTLASFSGQTPRRSAKHVFLKRDAGLREDMARESRWLEVELVFTDAGGANPARNLNAFETSVNVEPIQLLVHPIAGKYKAFCEGPQHHVDFGRSLNEIRVRVRFEESEPDASVSATVPDVATAAQLATSAQSAYQLAVGKYLGAFASANSALASARMKIETFVSDIETVTDPVATMVTNLTTLSGVASSIIGALTTIGVLNTILTQQITDYVAAGTDLFNGGVVSSGAADATANLLGVLIVTAQTIQGVLTSSQSSPAGSAEACGSIDEAVAACLVLSDAIEASRPPSIQVTVPRLTDIISFCQLRYPGNAVTRAQDILSMNHIVNPGAILPGTILIVPSS